MLYVEKHHYDLRSRMIASKLQPRSVGFILKYMIKLERTYGPKWLVRHMKERSQALLSPKDVYKTHADGTWYGPFRPISRLAISSRRGLSRALRILKLYGLFMAKQPQLQDYIDLKRELSSQPENEGNYLPLQFPDRYYTSMKQGIANFDLDYPLSLTLVPLSPAKAKAEYFVLPSQHIRCLDYCPRFVLLYYDILQYLVGHSLPSIEHYQKLLEHSDFDIGGRVSLLTKDGGLKLRPIFNPFRLLNQVVSRLHNTLYEILKALPDIYIYNQEEGALWASKMLRQGRSLSSIDIKSATDNIPMGPQLDLVKQVLPDLEKEIDAFACIARMHFWTPYPEVLIQHTRGHPMGVKGSFPIFTLFLYSLLRHSGGWEGSFGLVGDDMIVVGEITEPLIEMFHYYEIPISELKTLRQSLRFAEFVGQILDSYGSLNVYKAKALNLQSDPLGLIRQYGSRAYKILNSYAVPKYIIRRLKLYNALVNDKELMTFLASLIGDVSSKALIGPKSQHYNVGGAPKHIMQEMLSSIPSERYREEMANFCSGPPGGEYLLAFAGLQVGRRPEMIITCWHFPYNDPKMVAFLNSSPYSPVIAKNGVKVMEYEREPMIIPAVSPNVPDLKTLEQDALNKMPSFSKVKKKRDRKRIIPLRHIFRVTRILYKAIREFQRLFRP